jgi:iron complex outermembrane receptor protein
MWGTNVRYIQSKAKNTADISFNPESHSYANFSVFVQDDIALIPERLRLTLGSKLEKPHFGGTELQPNARLLWTPNGSNSVWLAASRASRTPSRGETESRVALGVVPPFTATNPSPWPMQLMSIPDDDLQAEVLTAYELGYRTLLTSRLSLDIALFNNHYSNLSQWTVGSPVLSMTPSPYLTVPFTYTNVTTATKTRGIEVVADWRPFDWLRLEGSYTYLRVTSPPPDGVNTYVAGTSPNHQYSLRWMMDLTAKTQLDLWLRHVGRLKAQDQEVPPYTELDVRLGYAVSKSLDVSLVGQNLLDNRHGEFSETSSIPVNYIPRGIYAKATWKF